MISPAVFAQIDWGQVAQSAMIGGIIGGLVGAILLISKALGKKRDDSQKKSGKDSDRTGPAN